MSILEYPQVVWWSGTFQHRYQRVHRRRVRMGHPHSTLVLPLRLRHPGLAFANSVDLGVPAKVEASGADFLVIHRDPANESLFLEHLSEGGESHEFVAPAAGGHPFDRRYGPRSRAAAMETTRRYRERGVPLHYEDRWLTVFDLRPTADASRRAPGGPR